MKPYTVILSLILVYLVCSSGTSKATDEKPIHQLRIYTVPKENRQPFHDRFKDHAMRIMKKYGFRIAATWESATNDTLEFVYLLQWPDKKTMEEAWSKFMADEEWKEIKRVTSKEHGSFVEGIQDRTLILTDYSPQKDLLR